MGFIEGIQGNWDKMGAMVHLILMVKRMKVRDIKWGYFKIIGAPMNAKSLEIIEISRRKPLR